MGTESILRLARLASTHHGVFTRVQALEMGRSAHQIRRRLESGYWIRCGPAVFRLAGAPVTWESHVVAAVYRSGRLAAASHATAGYLHGLMWKRPDVIEVVAVRGGPRPHGFTLHQSTDLVPAHVTEVEGIPITTIPRTIIDIGVPNGLGATARCLDEGRRVGVVDLQEIAALLHEVGRRGRNGVGPARRILMERLKWNQVTDSQLEDRFLRLLQRYDLPEPATQVEIRDGSGKFIARVDFLYPGLSVVIEVDGAAFHSDPATFRRDRVRQNQLILLGYTVLRFTSWDLLAAPEFVADQVLEAISTSKLR